MKRFLLAVLALAMTPQLATADDNIWAEKAQNPSWWPYRHFDPRCPTVREGYEEWYADLEPPCPTNRTVTAFRYTGADSPTFAPWKKVELVSTNIQLVATDDPFGKKTGYWPTFSGAAAYIDGKYIIAGGQMCNYALSTQAGNKLYFPGMKAYSQFLKDGTQSGTLYDYGYYWPSNTYANTGEGFSYNRSVQFHIYDVAKNVWVSSKWDGSGPPTYVNMEKHKCSARWIDWNDYSWVTQEAVQGDGSASGSNQTFLYDFDESGTPSLFIHGGYPSWDGTFSIYNPHRKPSNDPDSPYGAWSGSCNAINFSKSKKDPISQYNGGAVCIDGIAYVIGGNKWGVNGLCMQTYNTETDQWGTYENIYRENLMDFGIAACGKKIYLLGDSSVSSKIRVLDTSHTGEYKVIDSDFELQIPIRDTSIINYKDVIYVIGGRTKDSNGDLVPTDVIQVVNPALQSAVLSSVKLPVPAYYAACAATDDGKFLFGGSMLTRDKVTGKDVASSRFWTGYMPSQNVFVSPSTINYGQTEDSIEVTIYNTSGQALDVNLKCNETWLTFNETVSVPANSQVKKSLSIDRSKVKGPVSGRLTLSWGKESATSEIMADIPRPIAVFSATEATTLNPSAQTFDVTNTGTVSLKYTFASDTQGAVISPASGEIQPGSQRTFEYIISDSCRRPGKVVYTMTYNSYDGSSETFTVNNNANTYYVSPTGSDSNDGTSRAKAWKTLAYAFENVPNGSEDVGTVTLSVAPAVYSGDSQSEKYWTLDLSNKSYLWVKGETTNKPIRVSGLFVKEIDRPLLIPGDKKWHKGEGGDVWDEIPAIKMENVDHVRFSNFVLDGSHPDTNIVTVGEESYLPNITELIGINGANAVQIDNNYFYGMFDGEVYNVTSNEYTNWEYFWYCAMTYSGLIGPDCLTINNNLFEGFACGIYHNGHPTREESANTNFVYITANTFTKQHSNGGICTAISSNFEDTWYGAAQCCTSNIFSDIHDRSSSSKILDSNNGKNPILGARAILTTGGAVIIIGHDDYAVLSQYNQFYDIGGPGGNNYYDKGVTYELDDIYYQIPFTDYTNEVPNFVKGTWFKTDPDTKYGKRYVGWAFIPEPMFGLTLIILALAMLRRK